MTGEESDDLEDHDADIDLDGYCNCGSLHTIPEIDSGICDCCGGMIPDEEYS